MGVGSGGFYAAKQAFDQAAKDAANPRVPVDNLGPVIMLFAFIVVVGMMGLPFFALGTAVFLVVLLGTVNGSVMVLAPARRPKMRALLVAGFLVGVIPTYAGCRLALVGLGNEPDAAHVVASALALCASFAGLQLAKRCGMKRLMDADEQEVLS